MKKKVDISFSATNIPGEAAAILEPSVCGPDVAKVSDYTILGVRSVDVRIELDDDDERIAKVLALVEHYGVEPWVVKYTEYSEEDRQNARLLMMAVADIHTTCHVSLNGGTKYDMSEACPHCGTGARQVSTLYVDGEDLPKIRKHRAIGSTAAHVLVDGGMVKKLKDAAVTGISFGEVRARLKNGKWTSVAREQILIEHIMPPMRVALTADDEQYMCKVCRRGGRMSLKGKIYREEDLVGMKDFNLRWEWFGEFRTADERYGILRSRPSILVTPKVMNIFRDAGVKTFDWTPVDIET